MQVLGVALLILLSCFGGCISNTKCKEKSVSMYESGYKSCKEDFIDSILNGIIEMEDRNRKNRKF